MSKPYCCPGCKTNRSRFNIIEQISHGVKINPQTGDIVEEYDQNVQIPFHMMYSGPSIRIQCAACGLIEDERMFHKFATR
ncbi:DNA alkylation repair protein [Bacillus coahuilensis m2-6]|uniref:DNA alkylation repair protein n=1 Tax=Bacillus coahuilensis p1.1.43 TaxID=1150625 RepID=A0A147K8I9_9BACI|nr:hypothetical protein [Bacillus coahuilensis]KUP06468.1 DNA alkylation repair protein [Bacillus coahuilensis p1.1.43]KUP08188.1 DNA alkylation repair protein [Bacillus coahuilensis m2-6]